MDKTKKIFSIALILIISVIFYSCCYPKEIDINFVSFNIGYRETSKDYYLDFTLEFDNPTEADIVLINSDFYGLVNEEEILNISFYYAYESNYYAKPTVKANSKLTIRVRLIANVNDKEENYIALYYQEDLIIDDTITISNMNN